MGGEPCENAPARFAIAKSGKMAYLRTAVTFFRGRQFPIGKVLRKRVRIFYLVCENGPKIPLGTCFIDLQVGIVQTGG